MFAIIGQNHSLYIIIPENIQLTEKCVLKRMALHYLSKYSPWHHPLFHFHLKKLSVIFFSLGTTISCFFILLLFSWIFLQSVFPFSDGNIKKMQTAKPEEAEGALVMSSQKFPGKRHIILIIVNKTFTQYIHSYNDVSLPTE